jgi:hypothetical protein
MEALRKAPEDMAACQERLPQHAADKICGLARAEIERRR